MNNRARRAMAEDAAIPSSPMPDPPLTSTSSRVYVRAFVPSHCIRACSCHLFLVLFRIRVTQPLAYFVLRCRKRRGPWTSLHKRVLDRIRDPKARCSCSPRRSRRHSMRTYPQPPLDLRLLPLTIHGARAFRGSEVSVLLFCLSQRHTHKHIL